MFRYDVPDMSAPAKNKIMEMHLHAYLNVWLFFHCIYNESNTTILMIMMTIDHLANISRNKNTAH